jgi:predicted small secreted protein
MKKRILIGATVMMFAMLFVQCSKANKTNDEKGQIVVKITDAPSDDANIEGTFVTIADVKIDGKPVEGFAKQTVEISAYQNGESKLILSEEVGAKSYSTISLVLDYESDASGVSPGCYVLTSDAGKHDLSASADTQTEITLSKPFEVKADSETSLVVDFDIRKAIVRENDTSTEGEYRFVTQAELESAVRVFSEDNTGKISGKVNMLFTTENDRYVFVYHKGEFNIISESQGQGASNVLFSKAVTSAKVNADGTYNLSFLEAGDYEIHVASFAKTLGDSTTFTGMFSATSATPGLLLNAISVSANAQLELDIDISSLL